MRTYKHIIITIFTTLISLSSAAVIAKSVSVSSPNGNIVLSFDDDNDQAFYNVNFNTKTVIEPSALGLVFKQQAAFAEAAECSAPLHTDRS